MEPLLKINNVTKIYGGVTALDHVSLELMPGEVLALVGENGAGKSTLIKSLSGAVIPDAGTIEVGGKSFESLDPVLSKQLGISVVYQELTLCPGLKVFENIYLGAFKGKAGFVDNKAMIRGAQELMERLNIKIDVRQQVSSLSVAYMQLVEIAKAASREAKVLILDEPTASLTEAETELLFKLIRTVKAHGTAIIYISHRMQEVFDIGDRVAVMRDGHMIGVHQVAEINEKQLVAEMIGRELTKDFPARNFEVGEEIVLKVENLSNARVKNVSFELHRGEVLGLGGLVGAGRTEAVRSIFGADPRTGGKIYLEGREIDPRSPREAVRYGIAMVPEDRKLHGCILGLPIANNVCMSIYSKISRFLLVNTRAERETVDGMIDRLKIKTPGRRLLAGNLSGGNQQKVVLGKCLAANSKVLIFDEPTRGIDVGAKAEFYKLINELAAGGLSVIMISSEMDELLGMSDRIVVLSEGQVTGTLEKSEFSQENVFKYATVNL
ncbi:sugar ABC transporter ATP-binding protein [Anaerofilum hominis]|uniref:sugar ABC transporter ATP-binding protein n=1 Tax=Anaerofilum hominis TaxID=2763016 RepID=UPI00311AA456